MEDFVRHFGIDARLLLAQAVNFFILLFLLKRYAYGPILSAMKKRKAEIEKGIRLKEESEERMQEIGVLKESTLRDARTEAIAIVAKGEESAEKRKAEILEDAADKTTSIVAEARRRIEEEKAEMTADVTQNARELVRLAVSKVLGGIPPDVRDTALITEALKEASTAMRKQ